MANLPESSTWDAGVYQIETTDAVVGGLNGVSNTQAKALANRTKWLRDWLESGNAFLTRLLAVDGAGSGLDADLLDGLDSTAFLRSVVTVSDWNSVDATHTQLVSAASNGPMPGTSYIGVSFANIGGGAYAQQIAARAGALYFRSQENGAWAAWNKIWHQNNDGTGSGLDADLLRGLPADFTASLGVTGWQKLPSGLIVQWGQVAGITGGSGAAVTLPIAFPSQTLFGLACVANTGGNTGALAGGIRLDSKTQITVFNNGNQTANAVYWLAFGL